MIIGTLKEIKNNENRVALIPEKAKLLIKNGHRLLIETQAGIGSGYSDADYTNVGCEIINDPKSIFEYAELVLKVKEPLEAHCFVGNELETTEITLKWLKKLKL